MSREIVGPQTRAEIGGDAAYAKTDKGQVELAHRSDRLNPRARQLLILLDGRRRFADLCRLLPAAELATYLRQLEGEGFAARVDAGAQAQVDGAARSDGATLHEPLSAVRDRVIRALLDTLGVNGHELAHRLERCASFDELRQLLPAVLSVIEAAGGGSATRIFLQRAGRI